MNRREFFRGARTAVVGAVATGATMALGLPALAKVPKYKVTYRWVCDGMLPRKSITRYVMPTKQWRILWGKAYERSTEDWETIFGELHDNK